MERDAVTLAATLLYADAALRPRLQPAEAASRQEADDKLQMGVEYGGAPRR